MLTSVIIVMISVILCNNCDFIKQLSILFSVCTVLFIHSHLLTCCRISLEFRAFIRIFGEIQPTQWESITVVPYFFLFSDSIISLNLTQDATTEIWDTWRIEAFILTILPQVIQTYYVV